ncbi:transcriptional regulator, HxlR family [Streptomyces sp. DvalAA-14]|uniref:winged helix-turn-helix transcriptional regulator n=1 Tax=unclassified Streptomyces TaxID=2593676 RepID=UPI00081B4EA9|nr:MULTISPECIES: winged helix-turn-helix transcriptional regulator [unclassified Streptomyces]MYS19634.1 transcriptional regulator [Streptomyces sp. SID4948]SCD49398.1 transcriptional regulator, HxlR family [Streptomyces sp. DvalAA-14]
MKSYQQYCSVARALDVVGDRWVLLIVRELLALGPSRYSDLKRGLPGIASNLLADRLKMMEAEGLLERYDAPPPVGTGLYRLTPRGRELQDVLQALARWGLERMHTGAADDDAVRPQWSALFAGFELPPHVAPQTEVVVGIETGGETVHAILRHGTFEIRRGAAPDADITLSGEATLVGAVLSGRLTPEQAADLGLRIAGAPSLLTDLLRSRAAHPPPRSGAMS